MDVVDGKIVEIRNPAGGLYLTDQQQHRIMADHAWSGLKPSSARLVEAGSSRRPEGSFSRGPREWVPSWVTPNNAASCDESTTSSMSPQLLGTWGGPAPGGHGQAPTGLAPAPGAPARWNRDMGRSGPNHGINFLPAAGILLQPVADHRPGWKRSSSASPRIWSIDQRHYRFDTSPCSELKLDEEMTMFESQITRTVSDHFSKLTSLTSSPKQNFSSLGAKESAAPGVSSPVEKKSSEFVGNSSDQLKRKRSGLPQSDIQIDCGWIHPLKLLVRKGLTLSDVGELGRIIIPKKDAESPSFPQMDTKEGTVLEMEDYTASKRWCFRFKYWVNNKSRMYVLENTGEFIRYHSLKEHDMFIVYEDGCKNLVVCGQKKHIENLDPLLEFGSIFEGSASGTPPTTIEDESSRTTNMPVPEEDAIILP